MSASENKRKTWLTALIITLAVTVLSFVGTVIFSLKILYIPLILCVLICTAGLILLPIFYNKLVK